MAWQDGMGHRNCAIVPSGCLVVGMGTVKLGIGFHPDNMVVGQQRLKGTNLSGIRSQFAGAPYLAKMGYSKNFIIFHTRREGC